jgi:hypothetical protein
VSRLSPGDTVVATRDLPLVPRGTHGIVEHVDRGFLSDRLRIRFDTGVFPHTATSVSSNVVRRGYGLGWGAHRSWRLAKTGFNFWLWWPLIVTGMVAFGQAAGGWNTLFGALWQTVRGPVEILAGACVVLCLVTFLARRRS